ncbi:erythromycin esterase family protein [Pontibacter qinzhouensis]|uniref:Erythromycin esterase family protein n=1 Tax=Pontibacter qinzhouensis TaxID=2603253 RepID=A0A5C8J948_9BACT|nr:erythromycin esterase family protein [Pontibacter qinzhouensis]TXK33801.1 erythromycin esterase family protein [Pontibacter qinzhouensis]
MFRLFVLFIFFATPAVYAQVNDIDWINRNAFELKSDSDSGNDDLLFLSKELKGKTVVGLGEASHGTREFYVQKRRIIESLISQYDFKLLSFEFPYSAIAPINLYLQSGQGDLKQLMQPLVLYNTEEIYELFQWIRVYNKTKSPKNKVVLHGFDSEDFWYDALIREMLMAEKLIETHNSIGGKTIVWAHNLHIAKDTTMAKVPGMGSHLKKQFGKKFYVIGFDTYQGSVNVLNSGKFEMHRFEGKENTLSGTFSKAKYEAFFLPFNTKPSPFTGMTGYITNIYSIWQEPTPVPIRPGVDFDGIIFIKNTTASVKLSQ